MKQILILLLLASGTTYAYNVDVKVYNTVAKVIGSENVNRKTAADEDEAAEPNYIVYHSPDSKMKNKTYVVDQSSWANFRRGGNSRLDLFLKLYYANIKDVSRSGQRHVGCFFGNAEDFASQFFKNDLPISNLENLYVTVSEDRKMIGFEFDYKNFGTKKSAITAHFRLPHCIHGAKTPLYDLKLATAMNKGMPENSRMVASEVKLRLPAAATEGENGFDVYDKLGKQDEMSESTKKLPRFKVRADYNSMRPQADQRPWKGMDIRTEAGAQKFAQTVIDYFYDSLLQDSKNANNNFNASKIAADKVQWCHMPWLNVGDSGRELVHGLTKERDIEPSEIYPDAGTSKQTEGSDWGIGFYNDIACASVQDVFASLPVNFTTDDVKKAASQLPNFKNFSFPDGSVSVKVLFTTAKLDALKGSYSWIANVSPPKSTSRKLSEVRMVQIDVAVKDSTLLGVRKEADGWMMTTFYYDASYVANSKLSLTGVWEGLKHMRPIGVQTGFDPSTSMIFTGSKTNSANNEFYGANPRLMNGPADNAKASCLSCHGAAGTTTKMVPGVKDFNLYGKIKKSALDFSQQLALAKRNFETRAGQKEAKGRW